MKPSCPKCAPFPHIADWPKLGEEVSGYRTCPVCGNKFNDKLEIVTTHQPKVEMEDPSNPGEYMAAYAEYKQNTRIRNLIIKWNMFDKNYVIYRIAEREDVRPGIVRGIYDSMYPQREQLHPKDIDGKFINKYVE